MELGMPSKKRATVKKRGPTSKIRIEDPSKAINSEADLTKAGEDIPPVNMFSVWHRQLIRNENSALYRDDRFVDWLAEDLRASIDDAVGDDAWSDDEVLRVARSIQASVAATKCKLQRFVGPPEFLTPGFLGGPSYVLEDARRAGAAPCLDLAVAAGIGREMWDEECSTWIRLPLEIPHGNYVALKVAGDSMRPLLHPDDVILVRLESTPSSGDVVVARVDDDGFVVKRVGHVTPSSIELLPVNPDFPAIQIPRDGRPVIGTVVLRWCDHAATNTED